MEGIQYQDVIAEMDKCQMKGLSLHRFIHLSSSPSKKWYICCGQLDGSHLNVLKNVGKKRQKILRLSGINFVFFYPHFPSMLLILTYIP